jgi:ATP-dependent helicase/nuclease subunit A
VQPALLAEGREIINALQETGVTTRHIDTGEYTIRIPPEPIDRTATPAAVEAIEWDLEPTDTAAPPLTTTATSLVSRLHGTADAPDGAGFTPPEFEWNVPAAAREIPSVDSETAPEANDLGTIVHGVCEFDPTPADRDEIVARLAAGMGLKLDEHAVDHIRAHADRGIAFHRAAAATFTDPTVYHEFPATVRLGDRRVIGEIDYLAVTDEGFHIIDYKTNRISEDGGVDQLAAHYQPQLETYAAAVLQHDPSKRVTATLYFTRADEARQLTFDEAASARSTVEDRLVAYLDRVDAE